MIACDVSPVAMFLKGALNATLAWQSSEGVVTGGKASVGEDCGVQPGEEVGDPGVHVRQVLYDEYHFQGLSKSVKYKCKY